MKSDDPSLQLAKARAVISAAAADRAKQEHTLKMLKMENARLRHMLALARREQKEAAE